MRTLVGMSLDVPAFLVFKLPTNFKTLSNVVSEKLKVGPFWTISCIFKILGWFEYFLIEAKTGSCSWLSVKCSIGEGIFKFLTAFLKKLLNVSAISWDSLIILFLSK